jgi:hypothetical protein
MFLPNPETIDTLLYRILYQLFSSASGGYSGNLRCAWSPPFLLFEFRKDITIKIIGHGLTAASRIFINQSGNNYI